MNRCTFEDDLTAFLDHELPPERAAALSGHLPGCADCRAVESLLRRTVASLDALPAYEPSPALRRRVLTRLSAPPTWTERLGALLRPAVLVPSLLGLALVALLLGKGLSPATPPELAVEELAEPGQEELAMNLEVVEDLDVLGLDSPEDLDVIEALHTLSPSPEVTP